MKVGLGGQKGELMSPSHECDDHHCTIWIVKLDVSGVYARVCEAVMEKVS